MALLIKYVEQRRRSIAVNVVFCLILTISFRLYHLPVLAVIYPAALCVFLGLILMTLDFLRIKRKHKALRRIECLTDTMIRTLPRADGIEEEAYQQIIDLIRREYNEFRLATDNRYADMMDYYTVWVHQIKTPIASMRLHLQNQEATISHKLSLDLFRIEQYVEMVLTFLRLHSDSTDYVIREYDLDTMITHTIKKFTGEFISRKLSLTYEPLHTTVITDEKWLSFVIEQVLSNALKYTPSGSITITLAPEKKLCIRDTGIGIGQTDLPRIFENGFTGCNGRADKQASGLGLYLCKRICTNLGHTIQAESVPEQGTAISIDLSQTKHGIINE